MRAEEQRVVYVPMAADIIHPGHINIIRIASSYGKVVIGLFTDDAIQEYKSEPLMKWNQRAEVVGAIKGVWKVIPQVSRDYEPNLRSLKPDYMVHGKDWLEGPLAEVRKRAISVMSEWDGKVIEPDYTKGVSSSSLKERLQARKDA